MYREIENGTIVVDMRNRFLKRANEKNNRGLTRNNREDMSYLLPAKNITSEGEVLGCGIQKQCSNSAVIFRES